MDKSVARGCFTVAAGGARFRARLLVFDKDGLLFQCQTHWRELVRARSLALGERYSEAFVHSWLMRFGVDCDDAGLPRRIDPDGILALAPQQEEEAVTAAMLQTRENLTWTEARMSAHEAFKRGNALYSVQNAASPQTGFPGIFLRAAEAGIPLGIATSDTETRVREALSLYDAGDIPEFIITPEDVACGKPAPDMLQRIAEMRRIPCERIVMIGDSFVDTEMAWAAGSIGIGIPETIEMERRMRPHASAIVKSLDEILFL